MGVKSSATCPLQRRDAQGRPVSLEVLIKGAEWRRSTGGRAIIFFFFFYRNEYGPKAATWNIKSIEILNQKGYNTSEFQETAATTSPSGSTGYLHVCLCLIVKEMEHD